jgi:hypothetical protein
MVFTYFSKTVFYLLDFYSFILKVFTKVACFQAFFFITPIDEYTCSTLVSKYLLLVWYRSAYHSRLPAPSLPHRGPQAEREEQVSL